MGTTVSIDVRPPLIASRSSSTRSSSSSATSTRGSARTATTARSAGWPAARSSSRRLQPRRAPRHGRLRPPRGRDRRRVRRPAASAGRPARSVRLRQGLGDRGGRLAHRQRRRPQLLDQRRRRHRRPRRGRARAVRGGSASATPTMPTRSRPCWPSRTGPSRRPARYERGEHIADPRGLAGRRRGLRSVTRRRARARLHRCLRDRGLRDGPRRPALARVRARDRRTTRPTRSPTTTAWSGPRGWSATWSARADRAARPLRRPRPPAGRRQADHEPGAALGAVGDLDPAAVALDDPLARSRGPSPVPPPGAPGAR